MKPRSSVPLITCIGACLLALGCDDMMTAGGSDEIDTAVGRLAVDRSGAPVALARVALIPAGDSSGKAVAVSAADSTGVLPDFRVPDGYYGMLLRDPGDSLGRFIDSVEVSDGKLPNGRDTLLSLGSVRGVVRVAPGHSPAMVAMGLIGTDILANVLADGTFDIQLVPGGVYTLAALPSMEGYGPLYKRIQLMDGQDLVLADTLTMPFAGMPAPGGVVVTQDTATGDVVVKWNSVVHPDLYGYLVEALEGGVVVRSRFLQDTTWVDSLGVDWVKMALFGPWSDRKVVYRISSRSRNGAPDVKNAAPEFVAHPPAWTTRIDSVELRIDTLPGGDARVAWNRLEHPAMKGWVVERWTGGTMDCSGEVFAQDTVWMDSSCPVRGWELVDSGLWAYSGTAGITQAVSSTYRLSAKRSRDGASGSQWSVGVAEGELAPPAGPVFDGVAAGKWGAYERQSNSYDLRRLVAAGDWLVQVIGDSPFPLHYKEIRSVSRDGTVWETCGKAGIPVGEGDSLWVVRPTSDAKGVVWEVRTGVGAWRADSLHLPFGVSGVNWVVRDTAGFLVGVQEETWNATIKNYRALRISGKTWSLIDSAMDIQYGESYSPSLFASQKGGYDILTGSSYPTGSKICHADRTPAMLDRSACTILGISASVALGPWGAFPTTLHWNYMGDWEDKPGSTTKRLALMDSTGNGVVVQLPLGAEKPALRGNELWVPVGETLWKGTIVTR